MYSICIRTVGLSEWYESERPLKNLGRGRVLRLGNVCAFTTHAGLWNRDLIQFSYSRTLHMYSMLWFIYFHFYSYCSNNSGTHTVHVEYYPAEFNTTLLNWIWWTKENIIRAFEKQTLHSVYWSQTSTNKTGHEYDTHLWCRQLLMSFSVRINWTCGWEKHFIMISGIQTQI